MESASSNVSKLLSTIDGPLISKLVGSQAIRYTDLKGSVFVKCYVVAFPEQQIAL